MTLYADAPVWFIGLAVAVLAGAAVYDIAKRRAGRRRQEHDVVEHMQDDK